MNLAIVTAAVRQRLADVCREQRITALTERIQREPNRAMARLWWPDLRTEINARSPQQVARMEQQRGLTP